MSVFICHFVLLDLELTNKEQREHASLYRLDLAGHVCGGVYFNKH